MTSQWWMIGSGSSIFGRRYGFWGDDTACLTAGCFQYARLSILREYRFSNTSGPAVSLVEWKFAL